MNKIKLYLSLLFFIAVSTTYSQNKGHFFSIRGDFDGDDKDEMIFEQYTNENKEEIAKSYSVEDTHLNPETIASFASKDINIPDFMASKGKQHAGFALLQNIGDLDNDGGEEIGYAMQWLDHSNLNTYHVISLKDGQWTELYKFSIRDYQLPKLPHVKYHQTAFGNTAGYNDNIENAEDMNEVLKREKELNTFEGFVKKLSLFNILVRFVNDNGLEEYVLWNLKSEDKEPKNNIESEGSFLIKNQEVQVPSFTLDIKVSAEVEKLLKSGQEEIIVSIDLYGEPKKQIDPKAKKYLDDYKANLYIGHFEFKLNKAGKFIFENQTVPKIAFENLKSPNYWVSINTFSSRKSSENNLFNASYFGEKILDTQGKTHEIRVKMLK